ncbi:hypothetical protein ANANG_G00030480 [Anguilla anguilla]|uniref:Uncharacterized protein n=1 Tax=Anguilla anguilla TaxID=7936 RepID=A0A9D3S6P3_ANGAN|nr:hypothetical protein ANANG_G00030480 [Anguilla anguilla]
MRIRLSHARTGLPPTSSLSLKIPTPIGGTIHLEGSPLVSCVENLRPHSEDAMPSLLCRTILCLRRPSLGMETKRSQILTTPRSPRLCRSPARGPHSRPPPHRLWGGRPAGETRLGASPASSWVELAVLHLPHPKFFFFFFFFFFFLNKSSLRPSVCEP